MLDRPRVRRVVRLDAHTRAVVDTLLPPGVDPELAPGALDAGFAEFHRDELATASPRLRVAFRAAVLTAVYVAPLLIGRAPPLMRHARPDRERAIEAMAASRYRLLRDLVTVLKLVVSFSYGADPRVRRSIGAP